MTRSLQELYDHWSSGNADEAERLELMRLLALPENKEHALQLIRQTVESDDVMQDEQPGLTAARLDMILQSIVATEARPQTGEERDSNEVWEAAEESTSETRSGERKIIPFRQRSWIRYVAAAVLLMAVGVAVWKVSTHSSPESFTEITSIQPGGDRAVLTLSDGRTILLDSAANGTLARDGEVLITKTSTGEIVYDAHDAAASAMMMNTMTTPRGGQYQLTLPDGTKVWLNAASSLRYPTAFENNKRVVEVTGEAYFEVKKDPARPFYVRINHQAEVEVTGTSFNINAYDDEPGINTTLVEGSVRMIPDMGRSSEADGSNKQIEKITLKPGQQASIEHLSQVRGTGSPKVAVGKADIEKVTAWKNGVFNFEGSTVKDAMRQLARWYDLEIAYDEGVLKKGMQNALLVGGIRRDLRLADVLEVLNVLGLHFRMEQGRRLVLTN